MGTRRFSEEARLRLIEWNRKAKRKYPIGWDTKSRVWRIWRAMMFRCYQKSHEAQKRYSSNGITVCPEWRSYRTFMEWAQASGYADGLEIDRINNDLGYSPDNCRWATRQENQRNRGNNLREIPAFGEMRTPIHWSEDDRCKVSYHTLLKRLAAGWPVEIAIATPSQHGGVRLANAKGGFHIRSAER